MYAVIKTGGKQYKVAPGDKIVVEKLEGEAGLEIRFDEVLLIADGENVQVGSPKIESAFVIGKISSQFRDEKILVFKKKRRHNYRRKNGHRQYLTQIDIQEIKIA